MLWSTSAAFADLDGDGDLDLYVANYLDLRPESAPSAPPRMAGRDYCGPEDFAGPARSALSQQRRRHVHRCFPTSRDRPARRPGPRRPVADLTGDARPDIFVANDGSPCWLFENRGSGNSRRSAMSLGRRPRRPGRGARRDGRRPRRPRRRRPARPGRRATSSAGRRSASSTGATRAFVDASESARPDRGDPGRSSASGSPLADLDGDGRLDLIQANGHVLDRDRLGVPFAMRPTLAPQRRGPVRRTPRRRPGPGSARPILGPRTGRRRPRRRRPTRRRRRRTRRAGVGLAERFGGWPSSGNRTPRPLRSPGIRRLRVRLVAGGRIACSGRCPQVAVISPLASRGSGSAWDESRLRSAASRSTGPGDHPRAGIGRPRRHAGLLRLRQGSGQPSR